MGPASCPVESWEHQSRQWDGDRVYGTISDMRDLKACIQLLALLQSYPPTTEAKSPHPHLGAWREEIQELPFHFMGCALLTLLHVVL